MEESLPVAMLEVGDILLLLSAVALDKAETHCHPALCLYWKPLHGGKV